MTQRERALEEVRTAATVIWTAMSTSPKYAQAKAVKRLGDALAAVRELDKEVVNVRQHEG